MGAPETAAEELQAADEVFAALAHASRRQILLTLHFRGGRMTAGDIAARFGCSWPTTSRHLKALVEAGLVSVRAQGRERWYELNSERLAHVVGGWLGWFDSAPQPPSHEPSPDRATE